VRVSEPAANSVEVCIIGYGPTGATLASLLGLTGISTVVIERQAAPYDLPRAVQFDDEVMRVFQTIGLADKIALSTHVSPGMLFKDREGRLLVDWSRPMEIGPQGWHRSYRFHQPELEGILRDGISRFPNVAVRSCREFLDATQDDEGVTVRMRNLTTGELESLRCSYLVGADGARSSIREMIGTDWNDLNFNQNWLVVDVCLQRDMPELGDHSVQYCEPERPATYVRGTGQRRRWEFALLPEENPEAMAAPDAVWARLARWINPADAVLERVANYTFRAVINRQWRQGRLLIAGDAAHLTPPFMGQGLCAGIRDAANLGWKLIRVVRGQSSAALLDSYGAERIPHVTAYIAQAVRLGEVINTCALESLASAAPAPQGGLRLATIAPSLGPGLAAGWTAPAHRIAPQPTLATGLRADDAAGYGFALFARPGLPVPPAGHLTVIRDAAVQPWLDELGAEAAMIRPDRYVLGAARDHGELENLLAAIAPSSSLGAC
jgi:3-(3-hydroxy-phenyl)propionate hydroxylase